MNAKSPRIDDPFKPDVDTEQYVLGYLLRYNNGYARVADILRPEHFAEPLHQRIYDAIGAAITAGQPATPFTLNSQFAGDEAMKQMGGAVYLVNLDLGAGSAAIVPIENAARILVGRAFRRHLIQVARDIQDRAFLAPVEEDIPALLRHAEVSINDASLFAPRVTESFVSIGDVAAAVVRKITDPEQAWPAVPFGLSALDELTGGMLAKELVIVGARPGMGKTAFAGHVAMSAASKGYGVAFFSMEMPSTAITLRMLTAQAHVGGVAIPYQAARKGTIRAESDHAALMEAEAALRVLPLSLHEGRSLSPSGILMAAKREQDRAGRTPYPLGLVIVDHIQKIKPDRSHRDNKVAEMTEISDGLHKMAGSMDVAVIALSQLNRMVEQRNDKRPELSDLRESGSIEQDADTVMLLFREAYYHKKKEPPRASDDYDEWFAKWDYLRDRLDVYVVKQRNGAEGRCTVKFDAPTSAMRD